MKHPGIIFAVAFCVAAVLAMAKPNEALPRPQAVGTFQVACAGSVQCVVIDTRTGDTVRVIHL